MFSLPNRFEDVESFLGLITSIMFSVSPIFTIVSLIKKCRSCHEVSFCLYFFMFLNCLIFFVSSLCKLLNQDNNHGILDVHPMDYSNLIGSCLCYIWCIIVLYHRYNDNRLFMALYITLFTALAVVIIKVEVVVMAWDETTRLFDIIGSIINVLMYNSAGLNVVQLFKQKKPELIRIETAFFGSMNSLIWLIWAVRSSLVHSIVANGIGFPLCLAQIVYFAVFYRKMERHIDQKVSPILYDEENGEDTMKVNKSGEKEKIVETEADKLNNEIDNYM